MTNKTRHPLLKCNFS